MSGTVRGVCAVTAVVLLAVLPSSSRPLPAEGPRGGSLCDQGRSTAPRSSADPDTSPTRPADSRPARWQVGPVEDEDEDALGDSSISDLDFPDANNVWAAAVHEPTGDPEDLGSTVLLRWDGSRWRVFSPAPADPPPAWPGGAPRLEVNAPNDIWVVRDDTVCHWDGSVWQTSTVPIPPDYTPELSDIEAAGRDDIWIVGRADGHHSNDGIERPFTAHWDGDRWRQFRTPPTKHTSGYLTLAVVAPDDIWAIGIADNTTNGFGKPSGGYWPIVAHWRGLAWEDAGLPRLPINSELNDITAVSANEVWAVGQAGQRALALRWNGKVWADLSPPRQHDSNGKPLTARLTGIASDEAGGMWAIGSVDEAAGPDGLSGDSTAQLLHWTNGRWRIVEPPAAEDLSPGTIALVPGTTTVWATGTVDRSRPVFLHNGQAGR